MSTRASGAARADLDHLITGIRTGEAIALHEQ
jgi:hypothetical protein